MSETELRRLKNVAAGMVRLRVEGAYLVEKAVQEIERLKRGEFTPEEFQALCHHRDETPGCTRQDFMEGCRLYQLKLFGKE